MQDAKSTADRVSAIVHSTLGNGSWLIGGFLDLSKRVAQLEAALRSNEAASTALPSLLQRSVDVSLRAWSTEAAPAIALAVATTLDAPIDEAAAATRDVSLQLTGFAERLASVCARLERVETLLSEASNRATADAALRCEALFERLDVAETCARERADVLYERLARDAAARAHTFENALFEAVTARTQAFEDAIAERITAAAKEVQRDTQLLVRTQGEILLTTRLTARTVEDFVGREAPREGAGDGGGGRVRPDA